VIKDEDNPTHTGSSSSRIDLGDDLVETTAPRPGHPAPDPAPAAPDPINVAELIQNAGILLREGFPEEAKKILRQVLLNDGLHEKARELLEEIHASELRQMFGTSEPAARKSFFDSLGSYDQSILNSDSDEIIRLLDRDLDLSLKDAGKELTLFSDASLLAKFTDQLIGQIGDSPKDRVDMAIGFVEMGLYRVAIKLLQNFAVSPDESDRLNAVAIIAYAHLMNEEPYQAVSVLQPVLNDGDISRIGKTECFYLMGRATQALADYSEAMAWYEHAQNNDPQYRDCQDRISRCKTALTAK
jgi:tetratricopeptide (TPR) repeat protein